MIDKIQYNPKLYSTPSTASRESSPGYKHSYHPRELNPVPSTSDAELSERFRPNCPKTGLIPYPVRILKVDLVSAPDPNIQNLKRNLYNESFSNNRSTKSPIKAYPIYKEEKLSVDLAKVSRSEVGWFNQSELAEYKVAYN
jgi:hypothetical protein